MIGSQAVFSLIDPIRGRKAELSKVDAVNLNWNLSPDGSKIAMVEEVTDEVKILDVSSKQIQVIHPKPRQSVYSMQIGRLTERPNTQQLSPTFNTWVGAPMTSPDGKHLAFAQVV